MSTKRTHTKSRLGCAQCKARRIKCDERAPCCANCTRRGVECEYREWTAATAQMQLMTPSDFSGRKKAASPISTVSDQQQQQHQPPPPPPQSDEGGGGFALQDLGLLHHFTLYTSQTLDPIGSEEYRYIWQHDVPRLAQENGFLMHAVLAFAAAHRATVTTASSCTGDQAGIERDPHHAAADLQTSRHHYGKALALFRSGVEGVETADKAAAFFCFANLISLLTLFNECGDTLPDPTALHHASYSAGERKDSITIFLAFVQMLHSSMGILRPVQKELQTTTKIGTLLSHTRDCLVNAPEDHSPLHVARADVTASLGHVRHLIQTSPRYDRRPDELATLLSALRHLEEIFTLTSPQPETWVYLLEWPIRLRPAFLEMLRRRDEAALLMLAHWAVPAYNAPKTWFVGDWPGEMVRCIAARVGGGEWAGGMRWVLEMTVAPRGQDGVVLGG